MVETAQPRVSVGTRVRIRGIRPSEMSSPPPIVKVDQDPDAIVEIVPPQQMGLYG